ncbi:membrane protein of ER body-like protein isoform X2 [Lycium barbarum]|uniref:membrane protein of ER body-like protein isoform X2 n=1 Tax=Lycium barbarum TaxID=112863 RepID=UPI00293EA767|nr:membrane protein of ER body-like protein isoform X2 [Lycium barbarum]
MAMEVAQHSWKEVVPETVVEAEETLIGRRARRTANGDGGAVNGDDLSSSDEEEAKKDKNGVSIAGIEDLAAEIKTVDFQKRYVVVKGNHETGNTEGEILSGVCLPPSVGDNSHDETGNIKGEILSGVCLPPSGKSLGQDETGNIKGGFVSGVCLPASRGHDSQDETGNSKGVFTSGVCFPPSLGQDSQDERGITKGHFTSGVCLPPSLGQDSQSSASVTKGGENERIIEKVEEETVELEFFDTAAIDKLHTHDAYCPNCSSRITKVVLRRVRRERIEILPGDRGDCLVGCLSCFSVFKIIGKKLNPFPIFGGGDTNSVPSRSVTERGKPVANEEGCFDLHWFFRKRREQDNASQQKVADGKKTEPGKNLNQANNSADLGSSHNPFETPPGKNSHPFPNERLPSANNDAADHISPSSKKPLGTPPAKGPKHSGGLFDLGEEGGFIPGATPSTTPSEINENTGDDCRIPIDGEASSSTVDRSSTRRPVISVEVNQSKSLEIVKSIVYGGLIESITSLGVVSSAAAADADTVNIVTIGVANLIGGLFVICQNLVDLKYNVGGGSNLSDQADRYRELLGQRKHFLLHATFALFSYFFFGLVPPVVYGFAFRKSADRDYKLIAVAAASLLCVIVLAIAKAYTRGANKFGKYFRTIVSYVIAAGTASGVAYAAGHLFKRLMDDLGWFDTKPAPSFFSPEMIPQNKAWASY